MVCPGIAGALTIRGLLAILLGLMTIVRPGISLRELVVVVFFYMLIDGLVGMAGAVRAAEANERWGALMLEGLTGIATAIITMAWQEISALSLIYSGTFEIAAALRLRKYIAGEWLLALSGVASLVLGILMIAIPIAGMLPMAFWIGVYGFVFGTLLIALGFRLRSWARMSGDARYGAVDWQVRPSL